MSTLKEQLTDVEHCSFEEFVVLILERLITLSIFLSFHIIWNGHVSHWNMVALEIQKHFE